MSTAPNLVKTNNDTFEKKHKTKPKTKPSPKTQRVKNYYTIQIKVAVEQTYKNIKMTLKVQIQCKVPKKNLLIKLDISKTNTYCGACKLTFFKNINC